MALYVSLLRWLRYKRLRRDRAYLSTWRERRKALRESNDGSNPAFGFYVGRLVLHPLNDGRRMQLLEPFSFTEFGEREWPVPADTIVDGASIPRLLWTTVGSPYTGMYRDASVIHDYYCDVRTRSWREVHRVFYHAMRASGVSERQAKTMFAAVYFSGPRWSATTVHNVNLSHRDKSSLFEPAIVGRPTGAGGAQLELSISKVDAIIDENHLSIDQIEAELDAVNAYPFYCWEVGEQIARPENYRHVQDVYWDMLKRGKPLWTGRHPPRRIRRNYRFMS